MNRIRKLKDNRLLLNIINAYIIKGLSVIIGVVLVKVYMGYFRSDSMLGIWYTILSLISWFINFDVGIGQGLRNMSVGLFAQKDLGTLKKIVSSAYVSISLVAAILLVIGLAISFIINWNDFFNISEELISNEALRLSVIISFLGIIIQMVLKLISSLFNAVEKTSVTNALTLSSNLIIVLFVAVYHGVGDTGNLIYLSIVYLLATTVPYAVVSFYMYLKKWKAIRPNYKLYDKSLIGGIMALSTKFFLVQILLMVVTVTNELFITQLVGVKEVVPYQIYYKMFSTILLFFSLITNPVWSSIARKWQMAEHSAVKRTYHLLALCAVSFSALTIIFCLCIQPIINIWLGADAIKVDTYSNFVFLIYTIIMLFSYAFAAMANAISSLGAQIVCYAVAAVVKYPLSIFLLKWNFSWSTIILVNAFIMIPYIIIQPIAIHKKLCGSNWKSSA